MSKKTFVHGYKVNHEDDAKEGVFYLENDLDAKEAEVFFYYARNRRQSAYFEDDHDKSFELTYEGDDEYRLKKK